MSTAFYRLAPPVTRLEIEARLEGKSLVKVWINDEYAGQLEVPTDELCLFTYNSLRGTQIATRWWAGGNQEWEGRSNLLDVLQVIDEYGELWDTADLLSETRL